MNTRLFDYPSRRDEERATTHTSSPNRFAWLLGVVLSIAASAPASAAPSPWIASTVAGTGQAGSSGDTGPATEARLNNPFGVVRGPDGALYLCEYDGNVIRRIARDGTISTIAGSGRRGPGGDGGPALQAEFDQPHEIRFDAAATCSSPTCATTGFAASTPRPAS